MCFLDEFLELEAQKQSVVSRERWSQALNVAVRRIYTYEDSWTTIGMLRLLISCKADPHASMVPPHTHPHTHPPGGHKSDMGLTPLEYLQEMLKAVAASVVVPSQQPTQQTTVVLTSPRNPLESVGDSGVSSPDPDDGLEVAEVPGSSRPSKSPVAGAKGGGGGDGSCIGGGDIVGGAGGAGGGDTDIRGFRGAAAAAAACGEAAATAALGTATAASSPTEPPPTHIRVKKLPCPRAYLYSTFELLETCEFKLTEAASQLARGGSVSTSSVAGVVVDDDHDEATLLRRAVEAAVKRRQETATTAALAVTGHSLSKKKKRKRGKKRKSGRKGGGRNTSGGGDGRAAGGGGGGGGGGEGEGAYSGGEGTVGTDSADETPLPPPSPALDDLVPGATHSSGKVAGGEMTAVNESQEQFEALLQQLKSEDGAKKHHRQQQQQQQMQPQQPRQQHKHSKQHRQPHPQKQRPMQPAPETGRRATAAAAAAEEDVVGKVEWAGGESNDIKHSATAKHGNAAAVDQGESLSRAADGGTQSPASPPGLPRPPPLTTNDDRYMQLPSFLRPQPHHAHQPQPHQPQHQLQLGLGQPQAAAESTLLAPILRIDAVAVAAAGMTVMTASSPAAVPAPASPQELATTTSGWLHRAEQSLQPVESTWLADSVDDDGGDGDDDDGDDDDHSDDDGDDYGGGDDDDDDDDDDEVDRVAAARYTSMEAQVVRQFPLAEVLAIKPEHLIGVGLDTLSEAQLEEVEHALVKLLRQCIATRIHVGSTMATAAGGVTSGGWA